MGDLRPYVIPYFFSQKSFTIDVLQEPLANVALNNCLSLQKNSHRSCSAKKGVLTNFTKFIGKTCARSFFFIVQLVLFCEISNHRSSHRRCSVKKYVLKNVKISQISKENTAVFPWNLKNFKSAYFEEHLRTAASAAGNGRSFSGLCMG